MGQCIPRFDYKNGILCSTNCNCIPDSGSVLAPLSELSIIIWLQVHPYMHGYNMLKPTITCTITRACSTHVASSATITCMYLLSLSDSSRHL